MAPAHGRPARRQVDHVKAERNVLAEVHNPHVVRLFYSFQARAAAPAPYPYPNPTLPRHPTSRAPVGLVALAAGTRRALASWEAAWQTCRRGGCAVCVCSVRGGMLCADMRTCC